MNWTKFWQEREKGIPLMLIDVREPEEHAGKRIKGAINIPMNMLMNNPDNYITKNQKYYLHCGSGGRSGVVEGVLKAKGYDVVNIGGIKECAMNHPSKILGSTDIVGACQTK